MKPLDDSPLKIIGASFLSATVGGYVTWLFLKLRGTPRPEGLIDREEVQRMITEHSEQVHDASYFSQRILDMEVLADERYGELSATLKGLAKRFDDHARRASGAD